MYVPNLIVLDSSVALRADDKLWVTIANLATACNVHDFLKLKCYNDYGVRIITQLRGDPEYRCTSHDEKALAAMSSL